MKALIVGYGFVGKATEYLLQKTGKFDEIIIQDPALGYNNKDAEVDYTFISVPTPLVNGQLDVTLLQKVYKEYIKRNPVIIRSTIGPDQVYLFNEATIMPEFLREKSWKADVDSDDMPFVIGFPVESPDFDFVELFSHIKKPWIVEARLASMFKLARNASLAMRVALANDFYEISKEFDVDQVMLTDMLETDPWVGGTHWTVPGPDGNLGFGGNCFPKDLTHMASLCYNLHNPMEVALHQNSLRRNKT